MKFGGRTVATLTGNGRVVAWEPPEHKLYIKIRLFRAVTTSRFDVTVTTMGIIALLKSPRRKNKWSGANPKRILKRMEKVLIQSVDIQAFRRGGKNLRLICCSVTVDGMAKLFFRCKGGRSEKRRHHLRTSIGWGNRITDSLSMSRRIENIYATLQWERKCLLVNRVY